MENWADYKLVLALNRAGTIRGAAQVLDVNHATVSRRLARINEAYDGPAFERVTGGYRATDVGLELVAAAERIEMIAFEADRKSRAVNADLSGPIRISMGEPIAQYLLSDELAEFARAHQNIDLTIETSLKMVDLDRSDADVVIRGSDAPPEHLVGRRLFPFYLCEYCARDYLVTTSPEDIRWLRFSKSLASADWIKTSAFPNAPISLKTDDIIWLHRAALAGHGMIKGACYMGDAEPGLVRLPGARASKAQDLWVLTHPDLTNTPRIKHLMQFLSSALEKKRDLIQGRLQ